ncbi:MAG: 3-keto-5-aminohexanoate cleavage protein [Syntrophaceae bacterium]|nr:3-keto-5-aminohexanoate cleavage protein [Syntrophaceae bacterium]
MHFRFCLGTPEAAGAVEIVPAPLRHMPVTSTWSIFGVGRGFLPMAQWDLVMGGHIRAGMEDNLYVNPRRAGEGDCRNSSDGSRDLPGRTAPAEATSWPSQRAPGGARGRTGRSWASPFYHEVWYQGQ